MTHFDDFLFHFDEFLKEFLKDFLEEFHRGTTASEIPEEASSVESLALLNAPRPGGGFGRSPLDYSLTLLCLFFDSCLILF